MQLTRFLIVGLLSLACAASGQSLLSTNRLVRSLTLDECIHEALEHNLRIQIEKFNPNLDRFRLAASYGYYDPSFTSRYDRSYNSSEGQFDASTGFVSASRKTDVNASSSGITGIAPTGLKYDLGLDFDHSRGSRGSGNDFDDYHALANIVLSQPLLKNFWIDSGRLNIQLSKLNIKTSELGLDDVVRQVVRDTQIAYYELIFAQDDVKVQEKALELADALVAQNREKVRVGTLAPLDEKQAESQAAGARADLIQAQRRLVVAENVVKNLITDSYGAWINTALQPSEKLVAVPEPLNLQESWSAAFTKRPDYLALLVEAEKQGLVVKYQYNQLWPEFNLVGGYGRSGVDSSHGSSVNTNTFPPTTVPAYDASLGSALGDIREGSNPRWNAGFIFTIPLTRQTERNRYKESKELKAQIATQVKKLYQDIQLDVDNSIVAAKGAYERVSATRQARVFAEDALTAEQTKLDNGKSTSFQVLQLQKDLTTARSNEIRALADYNEALAALYFRDGTVLERARVSIVK